MAQKMVATLEFALPEGDLFVIADKAKSARTVMEQAVKEIQKSFGDAKVSFAMAQIRAAGTGGGRRGRPPANAAANGATGADSVAGAAGAAAGAPGV